MNEFSATAKSDDYIGISYLKQCTIIIKEKPNNFVFLFVFIFAAKLAILMQSSYWLGLFHDAILEGCFTLIIIKLAMQASSAQFKTQLKHEQRDRKNIIDIILVVLVYNSPWLLMNLAARYFLNSDTSEVVHYITALTILVISTAIAFVSFLSIHLVLVDRYNLICALRSSAKASLENWGLFIYSYSVAYLLPTLIIITAAILFALSELLTGLHLPVKDFLAHPLFRSIFLSFMEITFALLSFVIWRSIFHRAPQLIAAKLL